jgi:hypothetical protein
VLYILVRLVNLEKCHSCAVGCATYAGTMPSTSKKKVLQRAFRGYKTAVIVTTDLKFLGGFLWVMRECIHIDWQLPWLIVVMEKAWHSVSSSFRDARGFWCFVRGLDNFARKRVED